MGFKFFQLNWSGKIGVTQTYFQFFLINQQKTFGRFFGVSRRFKISFFTCRQIENQLKLLEILKFGQDSKVFSNFLLVGF